MIPTEGKTHTEGEGEGKMEIILSRAGFVPFDSSQRHTIAERVIFV